MPEVEVEGGWRRTGESTNGPNGEPIAVWVNTVDGKIAPIRLAVEQAIARQAAAGMQVELDRACGAWEASDRMRQAAEARVSELERALAEFESVFEQKTRTLGVNFMYEHDCNYGGAECPVSRALARPRSTEGAPEEQD